MIRPMWLMAEITAADAFAIMMLMVIFLAFGTIGLLFHCMRRAAAKRDPHVDALLEELELEEREARKPARQGPPQPVAQPWEREADWWKNG